MSIYCERCKINKVIKPGHRYCLHCLKTSHARIEADNAKMQEWHEPLLTTSERFDYVLQINNIRKVL